MGLKAVAWELVVFGLKEARSCAFAAPFLGLLMVSKYLYTPDSALYIAALQPLPRNDFLLVVALVLQLGLLLSKVETFDEAKVILLFHVIGLALEIFKTSPGIQSWSYPGPGYTKILNVPLYTGFMYAAIGSFMTQSWRILDLRLTDYPRRVYNLVLCALIYANFFTLHFILDVRWVLTGAVVVLFFRTRVHYTVIAGRVRRMPLVLTFVLIGFFIWIAENIGTFVGAWKYPNQAKGWTIVGLDKISSWSLLIILSFIIVANLKHLKEYKIKRATAAQRAVVADSGTGP